MKTIKKFIRLSAFLLMIALASVLPVPITFYKRDNLPKYVIEQIDTKDDETKDDDIKELF